MRFSDILKLSIDELKKRKIRNLITILILSLGLMAVSSMYSINFPLEKAMLNTASKEYGGNPIFFYPIQYKGTNVSPYITETQKLNQYPFKENLTLSPNKISSLKPITYKDLKDAMYVTATLNGMHYVPKYTNKPNFENGIGVNFFNVNEATLKDKTITDPLTFTFTPINGYSKNILDYLNIGAFFKGNLTYGTEPSSEDNVMVSEEFLNNLGFTNYKDEIGKTIILSESGNSNITEKISGIYKLNSESKTYPYISLPLYNSQIHTYYQTSLNAGYMPDIIGFNNIYTKLLHSNTYEYGVFNPDKNSNPEYLRYSLMLALHNVTLTKNTALLSLNLKYLTTKGTFKAYSFLILIISVLLFILSMIMSLTDRTRWYGILKSIGLRNKDLTLMLFTQCALIGFLSCFIGLILSIISTNCINLFLKTNTINFKITASTFKMSILVTLIAIFITFFISSFKLEKISVLKAISKE